MKKQKKSKNLIREVINLIITFLEPYKISDEMLKIPKNVKRMGFKIGSMSLGFTMMELVFSFILKITNLMIEYKFILIGIILFMLYRGQRILSEICRMIGNSEHKKLELIFDDEIMLIAGEIIGKTTDKVLKYDELSKFYKVLSNESVLNTIRNYLSNLWRHKLQHMFDILEITSIVVMLIVAIVTNTAIDQMVFVPMILVFVIISFFCSAYISINREIYYKKDKEYNNIQSVIINDLLRVSVIVANDLDMRICKLQKSVVESHQNVKIFHKKMKLSRLFRTIMETLGQYGIIIVYLLGVEWESINVATIAEITAVLVIVETALSEIRSIAETINNTDERIAVLKREEKDMQLILDVYHKEQNKASVSNIVNDIRIKPFSIQYIEESENDKPFSLVSNEQINIKKGEVAILYGPSGSGKSTFMKMLTERIRLNKNTEIPSTSRFMFFDEKLKFGSLSIFQELFCCTENPNLVKMQKILENLHLWDEIKSNCVDIWQWMKEKKFEQSLSNGQKQRLILAKMLYWLDDSIDVLVLDECTSGLDDKSENDSADAERILEYIVRYANADKKRIVIIATHQNIDGFKEKIANEYTFRNLQFSKEEDCNVIKEI